MHVRLIGVSKCGCLSRLSLCGPVMDCRPVQGEPRLSPDDRWNRLHPPRDPTDGLSGYRKWMDGWIDITNQEEWQNTLKHELCQHCPTSETV